MSPRDKQRLRTTRRVSGDGQPRDGWLSHARIVLIPMAAGLLAAVMMIARDTWALWQAGEYGYQHLVIIGPYVVRRAIGQAALWPAPAAGPLLFVLLPLPAARRFDRWLMAASALVLAAVLAAGGVIGLHLRAPVDRLRSVFTLSDNAFLHLFDLSLDGLAPVREMLAQGREIGR